VIGDSPTCGARPVEKETRRLRVLVVHEQDVVRSGFQAVLGSLPWVERCLGASCSADGLALWMRYAPHVALVDLSLGSSSGSDLCVELRRERPTGRVLLVAASERMSRAALDAVGAAGLVRVGASAELLARAVHDVGLGRTVGTGGRRSAALLSRRQREVLDLLAAGATNPEIALSMELSPNTVKGHTSSLYERLRVRNRAEAVTRAYRLGLLA